MRGYHTQAPSPPKFPLENIKQAPRPTGSQGDPLDIEGIRSDHVSQDMTASSLCLGKFNTLRLWHHFKKARGVLDNMVELSLRVKSRLV